MIPIGQLRKQDKVFFRNQKILDPTFRIVNPRRTYKGNLFIVSTQKGVAKRFKICRFKEDEGSVVYLDFYSSTCKAAREVCKLISKETIYIPEE